MRATLLSAATTTQTGAGARVSEMMTHKTYQATVSSTGAVTATVEIEVSNDNTNWLLLATITLSGTTTASDGLASATCWPFSRADLTAISGTDAAVTVIMAAA